MCPSVSLVLMVNEGDRSPRFKSLAPRRARRPPAKPHEQNRFNSFWQKKWKQTSAPAKVLGHCRPLRLPWGLRAVAVPGRSLPALPPATPRSLPGCPWVSGRPCPGRSCWLAECPWPLRGCRPAGRWGLGCGRGPPRVCGRQSCQPWGLDFPATRPPFLWAVGVQGLCVQRAHQEAVLGARPPGAPPAEVLLAPGSCPQRPARRQTWAAQ